MTTPERRRRWRRLLRYTLFQIPGAALVAALLATAVSVWDWSPGLAAGLFAAWLLKDVLLYRAVSPAYDSDEDSAADPLIGARGVVTATLDPTGYVRVGAELWRAEPQPGSAPIPNGAAVRVCGRRGLTLSVEALSSER